MEGKIKELDDSLQELKIKLEKESHLKTEAEKLNE